MNERIKELEKQCWSHRVDGALVDGQLHFDTEKFAELIVQECGDWIIDNASSIEHLGPEYFAKAMKQHFGVEE